MAYTPTNEILSAIEAGATRVTRRVAIFESDGVTPWYPNGDTQSRLVTGSVSVDSTRDERRGLDLTLLNDDNALRPDQDDGLWYDKIIKVWRGFEYETDEAAPKVTIIEGSYQAGMLSALNQVGYINSQIDTGGTSYDYYSDSDMLVSAPGSTGTSTKSVILQGAFAIGKSVLTFGINNTGAQVPHISATSDSGGLVAWGVTPIGADTPLPGTFTSQVEPGTYAGARPVGIVAGAQVVATWLNGASPTFYTGTIYTNAAGGRWLDLHLPTITTGQSLALLQAGMRWLQHYAPIKTAEWQLGEFCIDRIDDQDFPFQVKITGRDYTKRPLNSKFSKATTYEASDDAFDTVYSLAVNSGIPAAKINLPNPARVLGTDMAYDKGTPRWQPMKEIYNSFGYDLFFDREGFLTAKVYADPITSAVAHVFQTGSAGNLVSMQRTVSDANLYNHLVVTSENQTTGIPYFGEAINTDPTSPTRVDRIGDRYTELELNYLTSDDECQQRAIELLKTYALESYDMSISSIYYPWMEADDVIQILDPKRYNFEPTKYMMDTLTLPLDLGPMTATAKRITYVGVSNE